MKTIKSFFLMLTVVLVGFTFTQCTDDPVEPEVVIEYVDIFNYDITGNVTFPDGAADGAVVYLEGDATRITVADIDGNYIFSELKAGTYAVYANYSTANANNARYTGAMFLGTVSEVIIGEADMSQDIALSSAVPSGVDVDNTEATGTWGFDNHHSEVVFEFPYDQATDMNTFSGNFDIYGITLNIDDNDLANSTVYGEVDLLSIKTGQPGRDGFWTTLNAAGDADSLDLSGEVVTRFDGGCATKYLGAITGGHITTEIIDAQRMSTWTSTSIEAYGDGYVAYGTFTLNTGVDVASTLYFNFLPGYIKGDAPDQTQIVSFEGKFTIDAKNVFGVASSHIGGDADIYISAIFSKAL